MTRDASSGRSPVARGRRPRRAGSFLALLLPGLISWSLLMALLPAAAAEEPAPAGGASAMQSAIEEQLAQIPSGEEGIALIMGELTQRLTLSEAQQKQIRPTVAQTVAAMEKSRDRFKAGEITPMALAMQIQMAGQKAAVLIEPVLDEKQQAEYALMRQEQRRQMMQAMQQRGAASAGAGGSQ